MESATKGPRDLFLLAHAAIPIRHFCLDDHVRILAVFCVVVHVGVMVHKLPMRRPLFMMSFLLREGRGVYLRDLGRRILATV